MKWYIGISSTDLQTVILLKFASNVRKSLGKEHSKGAIPMNKAKISLTASQKPLK